jgi:chromosome segregation ATPase
MTSQITRAISPQPKSRNEVQNLLLSLLQLKKTNSFKSKEILTKINQISTKEKLIQALKKELSYHQSLNHQFKMLLNTTISQRKETEINWRRIKKAYKKQRFDMKDYFLYTSTIDSRKEEIRSNCDGIIAKNEKLIEKKFQERIHLNERLNVTEDKISKQKLHINSLEQMIKENMGRKGVEFREFLCSEKNDINKIDKITLHIAIVDKKLKEIVNKIYSSVIQVSNTDDDNDYKHNELFSEEKTMEDLKIKLADKQIENEHLQKQVIDLQEKIHQLKVKQEEMELEQQSILNKHQKKLHNSKTRNSITILTNPSEDLKYNTVFTEKPSQKRLGRNISSFTYASTNKTSTINSTTRIMSPRSIGYLTTKTKSNY